MRREVWEGKIPVCFSVAEEDLGLNISSGERATPEPCYVRNLGGFHAEKIVACITQCMACVYIITSNCSPIPIVPTPHTPTYM